MERPNLGLRRKASPTLLTTAAPSCSSIQAAFINKFPFEPTRNPLQIIAVCSSKCKKSHHAFVPGSDDRTVRLWRKDVRHLACRPQCVRAYACVGSCRGPFGLALADGIKYQGGAWHSCKPKQSKASDDMCVRTISAHKDFVRNPAARVCTFQFAML